MTESKSCLLFIILLIPTIPIPALAFDGGDGSLENPYQIATAQHLTSIGSDRELLNKHYILTADIDMVGYTFTKAVIAPDTDNSDDRFTGGFFYGSFNGNGRKIINLVIDTLSDTDPSNDNNNYLGLFGLADGRSCHIANLGIENAVIHGGDGSSYVGILLASGSDDFDHHRPFISHCHSTGSVTGKYYVGGLVGLGGCTVINCYSACTVNGFNSVGGLMGTCGGYVRGCSSTSNVNGTRNVGGLIGSIGKFSIPNELNKRWLLILSYANGTVTGKKNVGGLVGSNSALTRNCYSTATVTGIVEAENIGGLLGYNDEELIHCYSTGLVTADHTAENVGGMIGLNDEILPIECFWNTETSGQPGSSGGTGLTTSQLKAKSTFTNAGWDFEDFDKDGSLPVWQIVPGEYPTHYWELIQSFQCDGGDGTQNNPYRISNPQQLLSIGNIKSLMNSHFALSIDIDMTNYSLTQSVIASDSCFLGTFNGNGYTISNLSITKQGEEFADYYGLFGMIGPGSKVSQMSIKNATIDGGSNTNFVGALAGDNNNGIVTGCKSTASVIGQDYVGGLIGSNVGLTTDCSSCSNVVGSGAVGGLAGLNWGTLSYCHSSSTVQGYYYVGGLTGGHGDVLYCSSSGSVSGDSAGGLSGGMYEYDKMSHCYSTATVTAKFAAGGLVCSNGFEYYPGHFVPGGTIENSFSTGSVNSSEKTGGLLAVNNGTVINCYSTSPVNGGIYAGGLVGSNYNEVINCYSTGPVDANDFAGGLIGFNDEGTVTDCFWDIETSGQLESDGGYGLVTYQMHNLTGLGCTNWDFTEGDGDPADWIQLPDSYPLLAGGPEIDIPDISGLTLQQAQTLLKDAGANIIEIIHKRSDTIPADHAIGTLPSEGPLPLGAIVKLVISIGKVYTQGTGTPEDPYHINNIDDLLFMAGNFDEYDRHFIMTSDIDLSGQIFTDSIIAPYMENYLCDFENPTFTGTFDGSGHRILNLIINNYDDNIYNPTGFGGIIGETGMVKNLGIENVNISSETSSIGSIAGKNKGSIINCYSNGIISCYGTAGGLVGENDSEGLISKCYSSCSVSGGFYSTGGLVGYHEGSIEDCYVSGTITGTYETGAFGGDGSGSVKHSYSVASLNAGSGNGRLGGRCSDCFYDIDLPNYTFTEGGTGLTKEQLKLQANFTGWDFENTWQINEGRDYPKLYWQPFGDLNNDSCVNITDLSIMSASWLLDDTSPVFNSVSELSGDNTIDILDLSALIDAWLTGPQFKD